MTFFTHAREAFVIGFLKQFHWITFLKQKIDWKNVENPQSTLANFVCLKMSSIHLLKLCSHAQ